MNAKTLTPSLCIAICFLSCKGEVPPASSGGGTVVASPTTSDERREKTTVREDENRALDGEAKAAQIEYVQLNHDFGTVPYPGDYTHTFQFKNTGNAPLVIEKATASCGCTVPNRPEQPIMPGEAGVLDVIFRPKKSQIGQTVTKKVTVVTNAQPKESYLEITAKVVGSR